jgi:tryptophan halogenase
MIKPVNNIIIVGGGSAGWMTAAMLVKAYPANNITLIESPNVPIVGVGESTIAQINDYMEFLEIDEKDFMSFTMLVINSVSSLQIFMKKMLVDFIIRFQHL